MITYLNFSDQLNSTYETALLVRSTQMDKTSLERTYKERIEASNATLSDILALSVFMDRKKTRMSDVKEYINDELLPIVRNAQIKYLVVTEAEYFKALTGVTAPTKYYGEILPCKVIENVFCVYIPNVSMLSYNEDLKNKINTGFLAVHKHKNGLELSKSAGLLKNITKVYDRDSIITYLRKLFNEDVLSCDIEAFSLKFWEAGVGTISFSTNSWETVTFLCDYRPLTNPISEGNKVRYGEFIPNPDIRAIIKDFLVSFIRKGGKLIFHNASYDVKVIIYTLFMDHPLDRVNMLNAIEMFAPAIEDSKLVLYLATNNVQGNKLSLKDASQDLTGNYSQDEIKDIRYIHPDALLNYNGIDTIATWYVYDKYYPRMVADQQEQLYHDMFLKSVKLYLQLELEGTVIDMEAVKDAKKQLEAIHNKATEVLNKNVLVQSYMHNLRLREAEKYNETKVKKRKTYADFNHLKFNPNSPLQLQGLIYDHLHFPIVDTTKSGAPSTGKDVIKGHKKRTKHQNVIEILDAIIDISETSIILNNFISSYFTYSFKKADGNYYLHGNFNIGGTVSGRLSSSSPNLQNQPSSGTKFGKIIKKCFVAPKGFIKCGVDFDSLEDKIGSLTTKDPNKLKVYTDGFDGHSLRAFSYYPDIIQNIDGSDPASVNTIADLYPDQRQDSKPITFALTYCGTYRTLMSNCGLPEVFAKQVEARFHELYAASDVWAEAQINQASLDGYVSVAFGLRVRTPAIAKAILGNNYTPREAEAERRTAINAMGQSYGMLNNRAGIEFQERVLASPYRHDIRPNKHIHDAQYFIIKNDPEVLAWANKNLMECVEWQELDAIKHDEVKLSGQLELFYPDWSVTTKFPKTASVDEAKEILTKLTGENHDSNKP